MRRLFLVLLLLVVPLYWLAGHQTLVLEKILNHAGHEYFENSIRLNRAAFDSKAKLHAEGIRGELKTSEGPYRIEISSLESQNSAAFFLLRRPVVFLFDGVRLHGSAFKGMKGTAETSSDGSFRLRAEIEGLGLEDLAPLNPENLKGSSGEFHGKIHFDTAPGREPVFELDLHSAKSGGQLPSRFFAALLPYLPSAQNRRQLETLIQMGGVVAFAKGDVQLSSAGAGRMKVFLHMRIPDYNFNLNLNIEIRVDEENFFQSLSGLMGANSK